MLDGMSIPRRPISPFWPTVEEVMDAVGGHGNTRSRRNFAIASRAERHSWDCWYLLDRGSPERNWRRPASPYARLSDPLGMAKSPGRIAPHGCPVATVP